MESEKVGEEETAIVGDYVEIMKTEGKSKGMKSKFSKLFWHGGSVYDAWFSCASNQWFEVLDGLLGKHWRNVGLAFNCTFLLFGSVIQLIACARNIQTCKADNEFPDIGGNIYYINDNLDKRTWTYIFGACCATTVFIPSFHNYRIWSFLGLLMTTYTAWYLTIASLLHGQVEGVQHTGPTKLVLYFTGATNILYTFGGHAVTVEIMHAMWKPQKFKAIYLIATLSCLLGIWGHASQSLKCFFPSPKNYIQGHGCHFNAHPPGKCPMKFITFGFACTPLYFVWEKAIGMHECKSLCKRAATRLPVVIPIWFLAIIFPFFGPINSTVGSLLVSFTVYIIPALAHIFTFRSATARENAVDQPPKYFGRWVGTFTINVFIVVWVLIVGFGFGGWASMVNFIDQIDTFGLFTKCYQCPPPSVAVSPPSHGLNTTAAAPLHQPFNHTRRH
ncbi:hypothetical protein GOBAR_AA19518 [Gossypium barbadense]|uniref:Amino acid transporter transmembrane domain-containing protein n=1 Tax=Gossypium barbadense TaxID=3634 RepID=A0A2P5XCR6_GOSBA|nr:hypothetical protein GOBAR_AA19518 [Gossypium barbadense]